MRQKVWPVSDEQRRRFLEEGTKMAFCKSCKMVDCTDYYCLIMGTEAGKLPVPIKENQDAIEVPVIFKDKQNPGFHWTGADLVRSASSCLQSRHPTFPALSHVCDHR